mgnify:CR=1 FL=1
MNHHIFISSITELQKDFKRQFLRICQYHQISSEKTYYASEHIICMLEYIKFFYQKEQMDDRTSKKALIFEMVDAYSDFRLPTIPMAHMFQHSPIEHLFYISLCSTMPQHIWNLSYIMPQKTVCNNKYHIDFALCDRKTDLTFGITVEVKFITLLWLWQKSFGSTLQLLFIRTFSYTFCLFGNILSFFHIIKIRNIHNFKQIGYPIMNL